MEESMYQRLEAAVKRLKEIDEELVSSPENRDRVCSGYSFFLFL